MKRFSLIIFALVVVLCSCNELADGEQSFDLTSKEEGRADSCLAVGERCYSMCDCCGANTGCQEGWWFRYYCGGSFWKNCIIKKDMCKGHAAYEKHTRQEECKKG
nr:venom protein [Lampona murina]